MILCIYSDRILASREGDVYVSVAVRGCGEVLRVRRRVRRLRVGGAAGAELKRCERIAFAWAELVGDAP
jgi:hypothetical protein